MHLGSDMKLYQTYLSPFPTRVRLVLYAKGLDIPFVEPPGNGASAVSVPAKPFATSFRVPSPPRHTTTSTPSFAAPCASRVAWPRRLVSTIVTW